MLATMASLGVILFFGGVSKRTSPLDLCIGLCGMLLSSHKVIVAVCDPYRSIYHTLCLCLGFTFAFAMVIPFIMSFGLYS